MNKEQAKQLIQETFENPFDKGRFSKFIRNLFNEVDESSDTKFIYTGQYIYKPYREHIEKLERIAKYKDASNKEIDILMVSLKKGTSLERARTMQRNLIAYYLNGSRGGNFKEVALLAYVAPNKKDWRFSLVKMDYELVETKEGKLKGQEKFTPARRWSFLVGENEKSHTAQSRFLDLLCDDENNPSLLEIEEAFQIETVSKEFFLKYRELFLKTKKNLDSCLQKNKKATQEFKEKKIDKVNFVKKLLG